MKRSDRIEFLAWIRLCEAERASLLPAIRNSSVFLDWSFFKRGVPAFSVVLALREATLERYQQRLLEKYLEGWLAWLQSGERSP